MSSPPASVEQSHHAKLAGLRHFGLATEGVAICLVGNQRTSDRGAIAVIGRAQDPTRDVIRPNVVTRTSAVGKMGLDGKAHSAFLDPATGPVSEAIYLDDRASGVEVSGNLLCVNIGVIELHVGWNNTLRDNLPLGNVGIAFTIDARLERTRALASRLGIATGRTPLPLSARTPRVWRRRIALSAWPGRPIRRSCCLPLDQIGRPQDRAGLIGRVRKRCALP